MNIIELKGEITCTSLGVEWKISQIDQHYFIEKNEHGKWRGASNRIYSLVSALNKMNKLINDAAKAHAKNRSLI